MTQTCGNCSRWNHTGTGTFEQRLKARFASPTCKITGKAKYADESGVPDTQRGERRTDEGEGGLMLPSFI